MAGSLNRVTLIGNLGKDPEVRTMNSGDKVANLSIATAESWTDKHSGEKVEKTEWHRVVMFGKLAEIAEQYLRKGSKVMVEGKLQTRKWTDKDGIERYSTEVVMQGYNAQLIMLSKKEDGQNTTVGGGSPRGSMSEELDDEIPFGPEWR